MKTNKKDLELNRSMLDQRLKVVGLKQLKAPPSGWVRAIRNALGMSSRQLAQLLGVSMSSIIQLEKREPKKNVTLEMLERVADKMECKLVYAFVPKEGYANLEDIIDRKTEEVAREILSNVEHSMRLELQGSNSTGKELEKLKQELKEKMDPRIWGLVNNK